MRGQAEHLSPLDASFLEIEQADPSVYGDRRRVSAYETILAGSGADIDPNDSMRDFFITKAKFNFFGYSNAAVDEAIDAQFREPDTEKRVKLVHKAEDLLMSDAPSAFTHHLIEYVARRKEIQGFRMSPSPTWDFSKVSLA